MGCCMAGLCFRLSGRWEWNVRGVAVGRGLGLRRRGFLAVAGLIRLRVRLRLMGLSVILLRVSGTNM